MLSFVRVYHAQNKDTNKTLGNFSTSFNKQLNPTFDYDKEPLASAKYATAQEACELGWDALSSRVYLGKLTDAKAVYDKSKTICDIYEAGEIKASMLIKNASTHALAFSSLKLLQNADGTQALFFKDKTGTWQTTTHTPLTLKESDTGYTLTLPNDTVEHYSNEGRLTQIDNAAQSLTLSYDAKGRLSTLTNSFNQSVTLSYDANTSLLKELKSYDDTKLLYSYNEKNQLTTVTYADNSTKSYSYDAKGRLTAIKDASGTTVKTYTYNDAGKVTHTANTNGANAQSIDYTKEKTTITKNGVARAYDFLIQHSLAKVATITEEEGVSSYTYDANGYPLSYTNKLGVTTLTTYNDRGLLVSCVDKAGTDSEEITLSSYHEKFHKPTKVVKAGVATFYSYNDNGQLTKKTQGSVNPSYKKVSAKKMFGYSAKLLKSTAEIQTKESSYSYNDQGLPNTTTLPNGATNKTAYDKEGTPTEQTNALGFTAKTTKFDKAGRPLESIDINGKVTTTTYDTMGRVLTATVDGQTTSYTYDSNGRVTKTTYPDGLETYSKYDAAGNTLESGDNQGAKTLNTYDANNNLIATETYKDGTLTNKNQTKYDSKNRVIATIDSFGNRTTTTYNAKGQKNKTTDALGRVTTYEYNALGQLTKETNPEGKTTEYSYNTKGQKTKVITPNKAEFGFAYDALQRVTSKNNPDRGETTYTYDISDNIASETNAKGETKTYTYDLGNRKTSVSYSSDATLNETYEYDQGEHAKGKLTQITDASGSTSFTYDTKGNIASKTQTINGTAFTTSYTYNDQNKLTSQTYPSGKVITYDYNAQGELNSISIDGTPFITDIQTNQNGLTSYTYTDGTTHTRAYDTNGRVTKLIYPDYTEAVNYNEVSNITSITADDKTKQFDYDLVDRLTSYEQNTTEYQHFTYDANGNRLSQNQETNKTRRFSYLDNTNTLEGIKYYHTLDENTTTITKDINYTYDATGNIVNNGTHTYTYDGRNRLTKVDENITYQYNYDNQRVSKTVGDTTTYYIYEAHKLVGEYQEDGTATKEYVYYNSTPIAVIDNTDTYKIYADHLNTPRRVADSANNIVWSWESKPFGEDKPTGTYTLNLRFPGQYFDSETQTHYNINRDYNPITGRYIQSDPIGFDGGVNTYLYVSGSPIIQIDNNGLDAVYIEYIGYPVYTGYNWSDGSHIYAPLGHAAVIAIDEKTGYTKYYEYGRYDKENRGIVLRRGVPNVTIRDGKPTEESLQKLYSNASKNWGKGSPTFTLYYDSANYNDVVAYAEKVKADPNRSDYMLYFNDCMSFANDAIDAGLPPYYTSWGF